MPDQSKELFIELFRKMRVVLLLIFFAATTLSVFYLKSRVLKYQAQCIFYMEPDAAGVRQFLSPKVDVSKPEKSVIRVLKFIYSNEMMDHIIDTYDLYDHYSIDTLQPYHREKAVRRLSSNTEVLRMGQDIIRIKVFDRNGEVAAAIANSIVNRLDRMVTRFKAAETRKDIAKYKGFLEESLKLSERNQASLDSALTMLKQLASGHGLTDRESQKALESMEFDIRNATTSLKAGTEGYINSLSAYTELLRSEEAYNEGSVVILSRAIPELKSRKFYLAAYAMSTGLFLTAIFFAISFLIFYYRSDLRKMFSK